jgi:hypothetical protein
MSRYEFDDDDEPYVVIEKHSPGVGSFLVGVMIGAGIALLVAPRSGGETSSVVPGGRAAPRSAWLPASPKA